MGGGSSTIERGRPDPTAPPPDDLVDPGPEHRPHLDGIRAVAVYLVVAFHAGSHRMQGGFIGVDVFFVLSGFLVTRNLLRDVADQGRIRFGHFYFRRVRRLAPAALVNLVVTAVVFASFATPAELAAATDSIRAAALWYSNWYFIATGADYFAVGIDSSPVAHYWSLSVEEQFYLLWPVVLGATVGVARRLGKDWRRAVIGLAAVGAAASLIAAAVIARTDLDRAYYGTDTRAYQVLLGALLAMAPALPGRAAATRYGRRAAVAVAAVLLPFLVLASSSVLRVGPVTRGALAAGVTVGLIAALEVVPRSVPARVLSVAPLAYLGRISYGTYLWHWIVILVIDEVAEVGVLTKGAFTAVLATALASLSMELVERPSRSSPTLASHRRASIAVALVASVLVGVVVAPRILARGDANTGEVTISTSDGTPNRADLGAVTVEAAEALRDGCETARGMCVLREGDGPTALLISDSAGLAASRMLETMAENHDLTLYAIWGPSCPWIRHVEYPGSSNCFESQRELFDDILPELDLDLAILVHRPILDRLDPVAVIDAELGQVEGADRARVLEERTRATVQTIRDTGARVLILEPTPAPPEDFEPMQCLAAAEVLEECRYIVDAGPTPDEVVLRDLAEHDDLVWSLDLDTVVCPYLPICDPVVNGEVVKLDNDHLALGFARSLGPALDQAATDAGVFG